MSEIHRGWARGGQGQESGAELGSPVGVTGPSYCRHHLLVPAVQPGRKPASAAQLGLKSVPYG